MVGAVEQSGIAIGARLLVVRGPAEPCSVALDATAACSDGRRPERKCATRTASVSLTPGGGGVNQPRGQRADKTQDSGLMT